MSLDDELAARMRRPQRHRLLQGYPALPALTPIEHTDEDSHAAPRLVVGADGAVVDVGHRRAAERVDAPPPRDPQHPNAPPPAWWLKQQADDEVALASGPQDAPPWLQLDVTRPLILGIIPHTQCVPRLDGCGFCTFPHDPAFATGRRSMIRAVATSLDALGPVLRERSLRALYIGGGTATLATPDELAALVDVVARRAPLGDAELSLEGTPALFLQWFSSHLKTWAKQPARTRRISMGMQTFDETWLQKMGRERFGDESTLKKIVKVCRSLSITTSADFLYNLPGQTQAQMLSDVDRAVAAGLDQICLYNLVLYEGLGTAWSEDPALVQAMPKNDDASANWLALRARLLQHGYVQSTLTNFERADVASSERRFQYEALSFSVEQVDALGVGPLSISTFVDLKARRAIKLHRRKDIAAPAWSRGDLVYRYDDEALRRLWVVRGLSKTRLDGAVYQRTFGAALWDERGDFAAPWRACEAAGLVERQGDDVALTPRGMFFADAVVSTVAATPQGAGLRTSMLQDEQPRASYYGMG